eukprot:gene747-468_t
MESSKQRIEEAANLIGITDSIFWWMAELATTVELPPRWQTYEAHDGTTAYFHPDLQLNQKHHPGMAKFQEMYKKQKKFYDRMCDKIPGLAAMHAKLEANVGHMVNEVMNRINKGLPPSTPEIVEKMALLFNVDTTKEHELTREINTEIILFAEKHFQNYQNIQALADPKIIIQNIRKYQVHSDVTTKPEAIVMCCEFPERAAIWKCLHDLDFYSQEGWELTHQTGKRKGYKKERVIQNVCSVYGNRPATCKVGPDLYCEEAYKERADEDVDFRNQYKELLSGLMCAVFPNWSAEVVCDECCDLFSWQGWLKLHRKGRRKHHTPLIIGPEGQLIRHGTLLPKAESYAITDRARMAKIAGPWLAFLDDWDNSYWFNFTEKTTTTKSPFLNTDLAEYAPQDR